MLHSPSHSHRFDFPHLALPKHLESPHLALPFPIALADSSSVDIHCTHRLPGTSMRFDYLAFILAALDLSTACECPSELPFCYTDGYCYNDHTRTGWEYGSPGSCGGAIYGSSWCSRGNGAAVAILSPVDSCTGSGNYDASQEFLVTSKSSNGKYYGSCCNLESIGFHPAIATQGWFDQFGCCPQTMTSPCQISNVNGQSSCSPSRCHHTCPDCQSSNGGGSSSGGGSIAEPTTPPPPSPSPPDACAAVKAECTQSCTHQGLHDITNTCVINGGSETKMCTCSSTSASSLGSDQEAVLIEMQATGDVSDYGYEKQEQIKTGVATSAFIFMSTTHVGPLSIRDSS